jgi:hypothetical protein
MIGDREELEPLVREDQPVPSKRRARQPLRCMVGRGQRVLDTLVLQLRDR